jgi:hypothetical protein
MLVSAISHSKASATRKAYTTARWLTTGKTPGIPVHTGQTATFGLETVESTTGQEQNIFDFVSNSA